MQPALLLFLLTTTVEHHSLVGPGMEQGSRQAKVAAKGKKTSFKLPMFMKSAWLFCCLFLSKHHTIGINRLQMRLEVWKDVLTNQLISYDDSIIVRFLYIF